MLDYEDEEPEEDSGKRQCKKTWRYRWNEETYDEVLARLLDLDQKRHEQEILGGLSRQKSGKPKPKKGGRSARKADTEVCCCSDR